MYYRIFNLILLLVASNVVSSQTLETVVPYTHDRIDQVVTNHQGNKILFSHKYIRNISIFDIDDRSYHKVNIDYYYKNEPEYVYGNCFNIDKNDNLEFLLSDASHQLNYCVYNIYTRKEVKRIGIDFEPPIGGSVLNVMNLCSNNKSIIFRIDGGMMNRIYFFDKVTGDFIKHVDIEHFLVSYYTPYNSEVLYVIEPDKILRTYDWQGNVTSQDTLNELQGMDFRLSGNPQNEKYMVIKGEDQIVLYNRQEKKIENIIESSSGLFGNEYLTFIKPDTTGTILPVQYNNAIGKLNLLTNEFEFYSSDTKQFFQFFYLLENDQILIVPFHHMYIISKTDYDRIGYSDDEAGMRYVTDLIFNSQYNLLYTMNTVFPEDTSGNPLYGYFNVFNKYKGKYRHKYSVDKIFRMWDVDDRYVLLKGLEGRVYLFDILSEQKIDSIQLPTNLSDIAVYGSSYYFVSDNSVSSFDFATKNVTKEFEFDTKVGDIHISEETIILSIQEKSSKYNLRYFDLETKDELTVESPPIDQGIAGANVFPSILYGDNIYFRYVSEYWKYNIKTNELDMICEQYSGASFQDEHEIVTSYAVNDNYLVIPDIFNNLYVYKNPEGNLLKVISDMPYSAPENDDYRFLEPVIKYTGTGNNFIVGLNDGTIYEINLDGITSVSRASGEHQSKSQVGIATQSSLFKIRHEKPENFDVIECYDLIGKKINAKIQNVVDNGIIIKASFENKGLYFIVLKDKNKKSIVFTINYY